MSRGTEPVLVPHSQWSACEHACFCHQGFQACEAQGQEEEGCSHVTNAALEHLHI